MSTTIVIGGGDVLALAGGPLSIADLGVRKTKRVSTIEFADVLNKWVVTDSATGQLLHEADNYDEALAWEREYYNQLLNAAPELLERVFTD